MITSEELLAIFVLKIAKQQELGRGGEEEEKGFIREGIHQERKIMKTQRKPKP